MEPIQIKKASTKCNSIIYNKNSNNNCNCKVENFDQDNKETINNIGLISNIRLVAWLVLIIIGIYLFKSIVI